MLLQLLRGSIAFPQASRMAAISGILNQSRNATTKNHLSILPKKPPTSPYLTYISQEFADFKKTVPKLKAKDIISALAARWRTLDDETREKYKRRCDERLKSYQRDRQNIMSTLSPEQLQEIDNRLTQKELTQIKKEVSSIESSLGKPRRVTNAFGLYTRAVSQSNPSEKINVSKALQMWHTLSEAEKQKYRELHQLKMEEYSISREEYERRLLENEEASKRLRHLQRKGLVLKRRCHE